MKVSVRDGDIVVSCPYELKDHVKGIPTAKWDSKFKSWVLKNRKDVISILMDTLRHLESTFTIDIDDPAKKLIASHGDALLGHMEQVKVADAVRDGKLFWAYPNVIKTTPFEHQQKAIAIAIALDSSAMFMEMGTGKTLVAIATIGTRFKMGKIKRVLVVAPLSVTNVWQEELEKHADFQYSIGVATGSVEQKRACLDPTLMPEGVDITIINYDSIIERAKSKASILGDILAWKPDMVICDESQRIKNKD